MSRKENPGYPKSTPKPSPARVNNSAKVKLTLVGLSSAAILSVYSVGYLHTSADNNSTLAAAPLATATATPRLSTAQPRVGTDGGRTQPLPTPAPTKSSGSATALKDGSYSGTGTSRHGNISVSVTVAAGKIASVQITSCQTRYPCSWVTGLPAQVVAKQSATVNTVSGATDSSRAFMGAVSQALTQARA